MGCRALLTMVLLVPIYYDAEVMNALVMTIVMLTTYGSARDQCSGRGVCNNGLCQCEPGYYNITMKLHV